MNPVALVGATIFDGAQFYTHHALLMKGDQVVSIVDQNRIPQEYKSQQLNGGTLAPGFIDLQVNGGGDVMLNNEPQAATVHRMTAGHRRHGTTSILPTLISDSRENSKAGVQAVQQAQQEGDLSVLGVHLEGPHFSDARRGVHLSSMLRDLDEDDLNFLTSLAPMPVIVTLAPERVSPLMIQKLAEAGIRVCAGHTDASADQVNAALTHGLSGFTHLYNAMRPMQGRDPGVVGAALSHNESWAGIIIDGFHVHSQAIQVALRAKPSGKLFMVSDAMATVGGTKDSFELYGETIRVDNGHLVNAEGRLAGAAVGLNDCIRQAVNAVGIPLGESLRMASLYPAQYMRVDHYLGRLAPNYRADVVHFNENFEVLSTWVAAKQETYV